jgi:putative transposase
MNCPSCDSKRTLLLKLTTCLGYQQFRCRQCSKQFNERTGTPYNFLEYPTDVAVLAVFYYYRFRIAWLMLWSIWHCVAST